MSNFIFSNEQKSIFEYDKNDVIQVNGSPGSGKTLVAIKKAILLAEKYNKKVLFLYYNKSLGYEIRRLFGTFDEYSLLKNKIVIDHIDNYIKNCLTSPALREKLKEIKGRKNKYPKNKFDRESRMSLAIDEYKKHNKSSSFYRMDRDFLLSEIDWLRNCDFTKEEYLKNKRLERGSLKKIDLSQKQEVLDILGYYRKVENEVEYFQDYHDYMISALYYLRRKDLFLDEQNYFDHIIIDEAQDFSKLHLEFIKLISNIDNNTESSITFFMDINQTINIEKAWCLNNERNLEDANFEIKEENVLYLNRCYRNVEEIYSAAEKLLDNNCYKSSNISIDERGIKPLRLKSRTLEEEINNVITIIDILVNKYQYEYSDFTIISQFTTNLEEKLKNKFPITTKNENSNSINLTTFYSAKGIESKVVFILGLNDEYFPFSFFDEDDFINLDFENNNFDIIFGRELSTNENITTENESKRYDIIKEIKEIEQRLISELQSLRKETLSKFEDLKKAGNSKQEEADTEKKDKEEPKIIENLINPEKIEKDIEDKFPRANKTTQNELVDAEINYINIDNQPILKKRNLKYCTVAYIIALEGELRDYYSKMCNAKIITDEFEDNVTLGRLLIKLQQNMVFKNLVDEFYKRGLLDLRNESLHVHVDKERFINFEKLKEVRKDIMDNFLRRFIQAFYTLKIQNKDNNDLKTSIINAKMLKKLGKVEITNKTKEYKGSYTCLLEDINGQEITAVTNRTYQFEKFYKFICEDCCIAGQNYKKIIDTQK